jgi:hypothetical protein
MRRRGRDVLVFPVGFEDKQRGMSQGGSLIHAVGRPRDRTWLITHSYAWLDYLSYTPFNASPTGRRSSNT